MCHWDLVVLLFSIGLWSVPLFGLIFVHWLNLSMKWKLLCKSCCLCYVQADCSGSLLLVPDFCFIYPFCSFIFILNLWLVCPTYCFLHFCKLLSRLHFLFCSYILRDLYIPCLWCCFDTSCFVWSLDSIHISMRFYMETCFAFYFLGL